MPFKTVRFYLDALTSPLYFISHFPHKTADYFYHIARSKEELLEQNQALQEENVYLKTENKLLQSLQKENNELRKLLQSPILEDNSKKIAQVLRANEDPYAFQIVLDQGESEGVFNHQPIADENGILGQIYQVSYKTSRAILICDYQHAIPVRNLRNDMAMIAQGNGCGNELVIEYFPTEADLEVGDELVSSGLDGIFPSGYPVAVISRIKMEQNTPVPTIYATPKANVKHLRYVILLWNEKLKLLAEDEQKTQEKAEMTTEQKMEELIHKIENEQKKEEKNVL